MIQHRQIGSLTEIYTEGGGFITESYPTNYHTFVKSKILTNNDSIDNYREATESEKEEWESTTHTIPTRTPLTPLYESQGAVFNDATGYYELNGLTDITEEEMADIYKYSPLVFTSSANSWALHGIHIRTNLFPYRRVLNKYSSGIRFSMDVCRLAISDGHDTMSVAALYTGYLPNAKTFIGALQTTSNNKYTFFDDRGKIPIETERLHLYIYAENTPFTIYIQNAPKLQYESLEYMVTNLHNTGPASVTVMLHPDAFARLTDELIQTAASKNLTFTSN